MADPEKLTDLHELDDVPAKQNPQNVGDEEALRRRHLEHEAMRAAKRAEQLENKDEAGNDEFSNIGPV